MNFDLRTRKLLKWLGYPLLGLFLFMSFLYLTFPYERVRHQLEDHLSASGEAEVQIGELGPRFLFGLSMQDVVIRLTPKPRRGALPSGPGAEPPAAPKPQVLRLAEVGMSVSLLAMLGGGFSTDFELHLHGGGEVAGSIAASETEGFEIDMKAEGVAANEVALTDGPPLAGNLSLAVSLKVPLRKWSKAEGEVSFRCGGCSYGDGKALLKVPGNPFLAAGVTIPRVDLGNVGGQIQIVKGVARLQEIGAKSSDLKLELLGAVNLFDPISISRLDLKLRLKIEQALKDKIAVLDLIEGQLRRFKAADGFYSLPIKGTFRRPQVAGMRGRG